MADQRLPFPQYLMNMALEASARATCPRKHVGAVAVRGKRILLTGYNGSLPGHPHCTDPCGCLMEDDHCVRTVHAEQNVLYAAARYGIDLEGAEIYVTASPCLMCLKGMISAGIGRITYGEFYRDTRIAEFAALSDVALVHLPFPRVDGRVTRFSEGFS